MVSGSGGPTEESSQLVDHFIDMLLSHTKFFVRHTTHMINILQSIKKLPPNAITCTLDYLASSPTNPNLRGFRQSVNYWQSLEAPHICHITHMSLTTSG